MLKKRVLYKRIPKLLIRLKCKYEGENNERGSGDTLFSSLHFGGKRCVRASISRLGQVISRSIIHTHLHKQNSKLVNA